MAKKRKRKKTWMVELDTERQKRLEGTAKRRRFAAGGTVRPSAADIVRELIDEHVPN